MGRCPRRTVFLECTLVSLAAGGKACILEQSYLEPRQRGSPSEFGRVSCCLRCGIVSIPRQFERVDFTSIHSLRPDLSTGKFRCENHPTSHSYFRNPQVL